MRRLTKNASTLSLFAALAFAPGCIVVAGSGSPDTKAPAARTNPAPASTPKKMNPESGESNGDSKDASAGDQGGDTSADGSGGTNTTTQPGKGDANDTTQPGKKTGVVEMKPAVDAAGDTVDENTRSKQNGSHSTTLSQPG